MWFGLWKGAEDGSHSSESRENVAKRKDKVSAWYIVQEGNVTLRHEFEETTLGPNAIIGILEQDWFICDYYASTDVTLYVFPCEGSMISSSFWRQSQRCAGSFLRSALLQRHQLFCAYADMYHKVRQFQNLSDTLYEEYVYLCARSKVEAKAISGCGKYHATGDAA